jgi:peptidoglycan/xylan/chitin deacetylase (PgdA/CDA1 family)
MAAPSAAGDRRGVRLPVLCYHRVGPPDPDRRSRWLTVPTEQFERQVRWLARHRYHTIRPADWVAWCREGKPLPPRPVLITFDDGYAEVAEHALPILERAGMTAVVFVVTGRLGGTNAWDEPNGYPVRRLMDGDQIRDWARRGIEFGGHSRRHVNLTKLAEHDLEEELAGCQADLTTLLGRPAASFAYPYGESNPAVRAATGALFPLAVGTDEGINDARNDLHALLRTYVFPHELMFDFASRVRRGYSVLRRVQGAIGLRTRLRRFLAGRAPPTSPPAPPSTAPTAAPPPPPGRAPT